MHTEIRSYSVSLHSLSSPPLFFTARVTFAKCKSCSFPPPPSSHAYNFHKRSVPLRTNIKVLSWSIEDLAQTLYSCHTLISSLNVPCHLHHWVFATLQLTPTHLSEPPEMRHPQGSLTRDPYESPKCSCGTRSLSS